MRMTLDTPMTCHTNNGKNNNLSNTYTLLYPQWWSWRTKAFFLFLSRPTGKKHPKEKFFIYYNSLWFFSFDFYSPKFIGLRFQVLTDQSTVGGTRTFEWTVDRITIVGLLKSVVINISEPSPKTSQHKWHLKPKLQYPIYTYLGTIP